jgi:hypothetical protein
MKSTTEALYQILGYSKIPETVGETLEAVKPLLSDETYSRIKSSFSGTPLARATKKEIDHINRKFWEWFVPRQGTIAPHSLMTMMEDLRQQLSNFNIYGDLFDQPND